jgi:hypothetical protein
VFFPNHCSGEEIVSATVSTRPEKFQGSVRKAFPDL